MDENLSEVASQYGGIDEIDTLWTLHEDFSVADAAALIAGYNPTMVERCSKEPLIDQAFSRYPIALKALTHAITNGRMNAVLRYSAREYGYADQQADIEYSELECESVFGSTVRADETMSKDCSCFFKPFPDWMLSTVSRDELVLWLTGRGVTTGFFFPTSHTDLPGYLDADNDRYAPKLAAAVRAWQAVTDQGKKSHKQALEKWLRENASKYGLTDGNGNPVNQAIDDCSKIANWQPGGGAPKSPG